MLYRFIPVNLAIYGFEVPKNYKDAEKLDKKNGNTKWLDTNKLLEHKQLADYDVFIDKGKFSGCKIPRGFRFIQVYTIFDVKVDVCYKSCIVTNGFLIATPSESVIQDY